MRLRALALAFLFFLPGCPSSAPAPTACKVDVAAAPAKPVWPKPEEWLHRTIPQPGNGWISSIAVSHDGKQGVYGSSIGGAFIPMSDEVTLIRFEINADMDKDYAPAILTLPGPAMRNFAALSWSRPGLAWGTWSTLGTAVPQTLEVRKLREIPVPGGDRKKRDSFPFHSSVAWAPGGDCIAATVELRENAAELIAWKTKGASGPSMRHGIQPLERIAAWDEQGVLLVSSTGSAPVRVRRIDPASGAVTEAVPPPPRVEAFTWIGGGWLTVDTFGVVAHHRTGESPVVVAMLPGALEIGAGDKRKWLRVVASDNGRAIVVEESVFAPRVWAPGGPSKDLRHMHVLTPRSP